MKTLISNFINDESGATMVEYALLVALLGIAVVVTIIAIRDAVNDAFQSVADCIQDPSACPVAPTGEG